MLAVFRQLKISDKRLWCIVHLYVGRMLGELDLSNVATVALMKPCHGAVIATPRFSSTCNAGAGYLCRPRPSRFSVPSWRPVAAIRTMWSRSCDMSPVFLSGVTEYLSKAEVTVDWFHIVQTFTKRLDEVRKKERREQVHPKSLRWALLKNLENENLTLKQLATLQELVADQSATADAWVIEEKLRWIQKAPTPRAALWRITHYLKVMERRSLKSHY